MKFEVVGIAEGCFDEGCSSSRIVDNVFDNASIVTMLFCSTLGRSLIQMSIALTAETLNMDP